MRRELNKVRSALDALLERFQAAVRTARRFAGMLFSSSSERLGGSAETVVSEVELDCPAFIWDDDPTGGLAGGGAANGEAVDPLPEERAGTAATQAWPPPGSDGRPEDRQGRSHDHLPPGAGGGCLPILRRRAQDDPDRDRGAGALCPGQLTFGS